jgi:hypothetical protein
MSEAKTHPDLAANGEPYRSLSVGAILITLLGLLCVLALISPLFWFLPVVTIITAALGLRSLCRNPEKAGRAGLVLAISLAIFFGAWATTRHFSRQWRLFDESREIADEWMDLISKKRLREAHQLSLQPDSRVAADESIDSFYESNSMVQTGLQTLFDVAPLKRMIAQEEHSTFEFVRDVSHERSGTEDALVLRYRVHFTDRREPSSLLVDVRVLRVKSRRSDYREWRIVGAEDANA